jgi:TatA/E family protein of Tat protein translocase
MGIGGFGMGEMILIFLVVLLLFGAKRLPEIGSALGKGIREFKGSIKEAAAALDPRSAQGRRRAAATLRRGINWGGVKRVHGKRGGPERIAPRPPLSVAAARS